MCVKSLAFSSLQEVPCQGATPTGRKGITTYGQPNGAAVALLDAGSRH
jgi:hypothetical protein